MDKKILIAIGALIVLVSAGGLFLAMKKLAKAPAMVSATPAATATTAPLTEGTLKTLLSTGTPESCSYSANTANGSVNGTVFVESGKMRGDFSAQGSSTTINGHMIILGSNSYIWTDLSKTGIKTTLNLNEMAASPSTASGAQTVDINQKVSYNCSAWSVDETKFSLPTDINFTSFMMPKASGMPKVQMPVQPSTGY